MPQWRGIGPPEDMQKWQEMVAALDKHEQGHICIALEGFNKIKQAILGINGTGQTQEKARTALESKITKMYKDISDESRQKQEKYDKDTNHGTKNTEQEQYNKQFTEECNKVYPEY